MKKWMFIVLTLGLSVSCSKKEEEISTTELDAEEMAQQIGETMAAVDESGGSSGQLAFFKSNLRTFARRAPEALEKPSLISLFNPTAEAATCSAAPGFGACSNDRIIRNFNNCTIGSATVSGTVTLSYYDADGFNDNTCSLNTSETIARNPNFTVTGLRGAELAVTKVGTFGQTILRSTASLYQLYNDGINRKLTYNGTTLLDVTTTITGPIFVSGTARASRTMNSGSINISDNIKGKTCTLVPSNVTWDGSCNCAVSGSWSGSCSTGTAATVTITSCGAADIVIDGQTKSITFDRCY